MVGNASLVEISAVASLIPNILKAIRSAGPDAAKSAGPQHDPGSGPVRAGELNRSARDRDPGSESPPACIVAPPDIYAKITAHITENLIVIQ